MSYHIALASLVTPLSLVSAGTAFLTARTTQGSLPALVMAMMRNKSSNFRYQITIWKSVICFPLARTQTLHPLAIGKFHGL